MAAFTTPSSSRVSRAAQPKPEALGPGPGLGQSQASDTGLTAMLEKTQEFFLICDMEDKGFITRRDMQRLGGELSLSSDELENVFDTLDADGNGYLTLDEFSSGFSQFLFGRRVSGAEVGGELYQSRGGEKLSGSEDEEERHFCMLMDSLGASNVFQDPGEVRSLWAQVRRDEPHLLSNFEEFLARVTYQIKEANQEKRDMESALKRKAATHDDEIQRLYEEMELQITSEKDRALLQDSERFLSRRQDLETQLTNKEQELQLLFRKERRLDLQCQELQSKQQESRVENVKLKQTNEGLQRELRHTSQELRLTQEQLCVLQEQSSRLHQEREMELYRVTEGMQRERATLLKQLELLREMNKHLQDERDVCYLNSQKRHSRKQRPGLGALKSTERTQRGSEEEEEIPPASSTWRSEDATGQDLVVSQEGGAVRNRWGQQPLQRIMSIEEDPLPQPLQPGYEAQLQDWSEDEEEEEEERTDLETSRIRPATATTVPDAPLHPLPAGHRAAPLTRRDTPPSPRGQPVGKETIQHEEAAVTCTPDRLFKVVLVGNSSVGKTCLLRRFCDNCFQPGTIATVGIDYSVKTITVENSQVALQMWDTAGQERYRSITKQFFRKVDGVVVMYDITAEQSFTAVRQWLSSVREGAGDDIPIMLLGNKTDRPGEREVETGAGERLAKVFPS
ncbi:EF-hand calcium-binding domain-containing protein 4B isoform X2 [Anguilla rostrata]|uniref:EF-hand calcium-binding domain-containing protein 4B isoform X2 n=1 Tax=Anguilla rostrata TaxID=7938 RepID=UPI0030D3D42B